MLKWVVNAQVTEERERTRKRWLYARAQTVRWAYEYLC
jgi:hypothetical protein